MSRRPVLPPPPGPATRIAAFMRWLVENRLLNTDAVKVLIDEVDDDRRRVLPAEKAAQLYRLWERTAAPITTPLNAAAELELLLQAAPHNGSARACIVYHLLAWLRTGSLTPTR